MTQFGSIEILENRIAPATLVDPYTVTFQDAEQDMVMVKISLPLFTSLAATANILQFTDNNDAYHTQTLGSINLLGQNAAGMDISVKVLSRIGVGDGSAYVGNIIASGYIADILEFPNGMDLGRIQIDGDLGRIVAGDDVSTMAIKSLTVRDLGGEYLANGLSVTSSYVLGPIGELNIEGDFVGRLQIYGGAEFSNIGSLTIGGALHGDRGLATILFTGTIGKAKIGQIIGGTEELSGAIYGYGEGIINELEIQGGITGGSALGAGLVNVAKIKTLTIGGDVEGGTGEQSGSISSNSIGTVSIGGSLLGGDGNQSGAISAAIQKISIGGSIIGGKGDYSGIIAIPQGVTTSSVVIGVDLKGGQGTNSGNILGGNFQKMEIHGSLLGGTGANSGMISANGFAQTTNGFVQSLSIWGNVEGGSGTSAGSIHINGTLSELKIQGDLTGISSVAEMADKAGSQSGYVHAIRIGKVSIEGSLLAGSNNATTIHDSGAIRSETVIGSIALGGDMKGDASNPAIISAVGLVSQATTALKNIAIGKVVIGGDMINANILAGYKAGDSILGDAINPDAQINSITIHGNLVASNIVAGVDIGQDELFGTADDAVLDSLQAMDLARIFSTISEVVVKGRVLDSETQNAAYGIVAQHVAAMRLRGVPVELTARAENDIATGDLLGVPIGANTGTTATIDENEFHVLEVKKTS